MSSAEKASHHGRQAGQKKLRREVAIGVGEQTRKNLPGSPDHAIGRVSPLDLYSSRDKFFGSCIGEMPKTI